ncbi:MAG: hypothetical protein H7842_05005 [Gammaproteobacteria bacterium SHHR-1]
MNEETSNPWKNPLGMASDLWQRHVGRHLPDSAEQPAEQIAIPVEELGSGLLNAIKYGLAPVSAFGGYSLKGVQYAAQDGAEWVKKGVNKARELSAKQDCADCDTGCEGQMTEDRGQMTEDR